MASEALDELPSNLDDSVTGTHVGMLEGKHVTTFRTSVQETLTELQCCTHVNDTLRCLAEVPALARLLTQRESR